MKLGIVALLFLSFFAPAEEPGSVFETDAVELLKGKEVQGKENFFVDRFSVRYLFLNEQNREEFLQKPERYEIQLGGACARMGPMSGLCRTDIFTVHEGKLYLFASESCKKTFLASPEKLLDPGDPVPSGDEVSAKKACALLEKAVRAMGGAERLERIRSYEEGDYKEVEYKGAMVPNRDSLTFSYPGGVHKDYLWDKSRFSYVFDGKEGWSISPSDTVSLHPEQKRALEREYYWRNLIAILRARKLPDFLAYATGTREIELEGKMMTLENVTVAFAGTTTVLGIEPESGRIRAESFRGRGGPKGVFGNKERLFTAYKNFDGLELPTTRRNFFDGIEGKDSPYTPSILKVDDPEHAALFRKPVSK